MAETTYTDVTWTSGDTITEAKMDSMVANDRAVDAMSNGVEFTERAAPSTPAANKIHMYAKDDGGTTRLYSKDSAGTENPLGISATKVKFRANRSTGQTISDVTYTKVQYNNEDYDNGSDYDNVTNYRFTAPEDGIYLVMASVALDTMADGKSTQIHIYKNGSSVASQIYQHPFTGTAPVQIADMVSLVATDYIEIYVRHDYGATRTTTTIASHNFFTMHLLSV